MRGSEIFSQLVEMTEAGEPLVTHSSSKDP